MGRLIEVMADRVRLQVVEVLDRAEEDISGREIARRVAAKGGPSRSAVQRALEGLSLAGVIRYREVFGGNLYRLNRMDPLVRLILPLLQQDKESDNDPVAAIKRSLEGRTEEIGALGLAMAPLDEEGCIEVLAVARHNTLPADVRRTVEDATWHVQQTCGRTLVVHTMTMSELKEKAGSDDALRERFLDRGIALGGSALARLISY
jgi:Fe2+ or Zn2+ uptake regulation protein